MSEEIININTKGTKFDPFNVHNKEKTSPVNKDELTGEVRKYLAETGQIKTASLPSIVEEKKSEPTLPVVEEEWEKAKKNLEELENEKKIKEEKDRKEKEKALNRQTKLCMLEGYFNSERFREYLQEKNLARSREELAKMSDKALDDLYHRIKAHLGMRSKSMFVENGARTVAKIAEGTISPMYDITGFSHVLFANPDFMDLLEEVKLEMHMPNLPLPIRVSMIMVQTAMLCNMINEKTKVREMGKVQILPTEEKKVEEEKKEEEKL